jgi:hypothetical protein
MFNLKIKIMPTRIIWWMNIADSSYFKDDSELTYAALKLFSEYERTCEKAKKTLKSEIKKLIREHELKQGPR